MIVRLAVVIPTLNAAEELPATLQSIGSLPTEVLIADGGSTDGTVQLAVEWGARVIHAPQGRGPQLRAGVAAAESAWLLLWHADTRLVPGWDAIATQHVMIHPDCAGYFRFALRSTDPRARRLERLVAWRCRVLALPYGDQGLLISRSVLHRAGGIRPLPIMEDVDLARRLGRRWLKPLNATAVTSAIRWERDGWYRRSLRNLACLSLWYAGLSEHRLARLYH